MFACTGWELRVKLTADQVNITGACAEWNLVRLCRTKFINLPTNTTCTVILNLKNGIDNAILNNMNGMGFKMFLNIIAFKITLPYLYVSIRQGSLVSGTRVGGGVCYSLIFI